MQTPTGYFISPHAPVPPSAQYPSYHDRRALNSELEQASEKLSRTVTYLFFQQLKRDRLPVEAHREAIAILRKAGQELAKAERRSSARKSIARWLQATARIPHLPN